MRKGIAFFFFLVPAFCFADFPVLTGGVLPSFSEISVRDNFTGLSYTGGYSTGSAVWVSSDFGTESLDYSAHLNALIEQNNSILVALADVRFYLVVNTIIFLSCASTALCAWLLSRVRPS